MITKTQKRLNNKELAIDVGKQLADARRDAGFLLTDIAKYYNYSTEQLDMMENGAKVFSMYEIAHIAAIYNKKIKITIIDAE